MGKNYINSSVYAEAKKRISYVFDNFEKTYVSFSGGKDSSVMLHMVAEEARKRNKRIGVLFVDLEGQYKRTVDYIQLMYKLYSDCIDPYWVCLPIALRNAVSVYEPKWQCWDPGKIDIWIRQPPEMAKADENIFPFFRRGMEFEEFVPEFGKWYSEGKETACFVGIRADESLNRYRTVKNNKKKTYRGKMWTTRIDDSSVYNAYPLYDWKTKDIWVYNGKMRKEYNSLYDIMSKAGLSIHQQRICQPYGDDQRKGLWLFHIIEPETWSKIVARVSGANSGAEFVKYSGNVSGQIKISKPEGHTWESFSMIILESMPEITREHYKNKIYKFITWYEKNGWLDADNTRRHDIPDEYDKKYESGKKAPSWRRIAKMLLRNDYWAKGLSFSQTKDGYFYKKYMERVKAERAARIKEDKIRRKGWA